MQPPTSGVGPYHPEGQPPSYPGPGGAPYPPQPGFPSYPPPQQQEARSTLPFPGGPLPSAAPYSAPPFNPRQPEKKRSVLPLVIGFVIALLLVGSGCFGGGYLVGYDRGKTAAAGSPALSNSSTKATPPSLTSTGSSPASTDSSAVTLSGAWTGSYTCNQGKTGLVLAFAGSNSDLFAAFSFYPLPENPTAKSGEYIMRGTYAGGTLSLHGDHWIKQPAGYSMVDLRSTNVTTKQIAGTVVFSGCSTFTLSRT